jgi:methylisocitrate lyase
MLAQADMGQSNMRDYADHYARICAAVEIPVYVDADTGFGAHTLPGSSYSAR